jgi:cytochrome c553
MVRLKNFCILVLFFYLFCNVSFAIDSAISSKLSRCVTCHTLSGNSVVPIWPKIAEQHFDYVIKQLTEFKKGKDGNRFDPNMLAMLQGVTESELVELAEHFSKQPLEKNKGFANLNRFENGKLLYLYGDSLKRITACVGCHGIDGSGNKLARFPVLKWQHKDYIVSQMKKFRSGERRNDFNSIMQDVVTPMNDEQINDVAEYIAFITD